MATRQYVGARYVPIINGEWDNTKSYDPLIIVTHEGNSYTSRTYVPVGVDILNETYWACTGNYNAQVEAYRQEVEQLSNNFDTLIGTVENEFERVDKTLSGIINFEAYNLQNVGQDAALYDGKLFTFGSNGSYKVFDFESKTQLASLTLDGDYTPHANAVTFGNKLSESDPYPLLYVTGYNGTDDQGNPLDPGVCLVYKVNADFTTELIQVISIAFTSNIPLWGSGSSSDGIYRFGDFVVDPENNHLYVFTIRNDYLSNTRIFKFNIPPTSYATISLDTSDIIEYFDVPLYRVPQGATYHNGNIYILSGGGDYEPVLSIVDVSLKRQIGHLILADIMSEPEAIVFDDNTMYVAQYSFYKVVGAVPYYSNMGDLTELTTKNRATLVDAINEANIKLGAANLIPITTETLTKRGLQCIKNADTGLVEVVGEYDQSATTAFIFALGTVTLPAGRYVLKGNPLNEFSDRLSIQASKGSAPYFYDLGTGTIFELTEESSVSFSIYYTANLDVGDIDLIFCPVCQRIIE